MSSYHVIRNGFPVAELLAFEPVSATQTHVSAVKSICHDGAAFCA
jgi:hypothetical protein